MTRSVRYRTTGFGIRTLRRGVATQHIWHVIRSIRPNVRYWPFSALRRCLARVSR